MRELVDVFPECRVVGLGMYRVGGPGFGMGAFRSHECGRTGQVPILILSVYDLLYFILSLVLWNVVRNKNFKFESAFCIVISISVELFLFCLLYFYDLFRILR